MAVTIDASTPARVTGQQVVTTATFDPPAGVLVFCASGDDITRTWTVTNNGTALTWTTIANRNSGDSGGVNGNVQASYAVLPSARTGMTVTGTYSVVNDSSVKVYVVTGADTASPIGAGAEGSNSATPITTTAYTSQAAGLSFVAYNDYNATGAPTSSDTTLDANTVAGQISFASGYKTIGSVGASVTHNIQAPAAPLANWVSFEIKPAAGGLPPGYPLVVNRAALIRANYW
jgi:hypothetical protein